MGDKRSRLHDAPRNGYGYGNPQARKKHKSNDGRPSFPNSHQQADDKPELPPSTEDIEKGLIVLLDQLALRKAHDTTDSKSDEYRIIHHAQQLRTLLYDQSQKKSLPFAARQASDTKRPETVTFPPVPYVEHTITRSQGLPPLPTIAPHLRDAVFTHTSTQKSMVRGCNDGQVNYERLEFLGDAFIEDIASRPIYSQFPNLQASHMSELRELLVNNETLSGFSKAYNLPAELKHDKLMKDSKGWTKVTADLFEAYVAAVVLSDPEAGFATAQKWLLELWAPTLLNYKVPIVQNTRAREEVNKLVMAPGIKVEYRMERDMEVLGGRQKFFIGLYLTGWGFEDEWLGSGEAKSKAEASVNAAADALQHSMGKLKRANAEKIKIYPPKEKEGEV